MAAFKSADAYHRFARAVRHSARYIRGPEETEFLDTLLREAQDRVNVIHGGAAAWRAQLGHDWDQERNGDEIVAEIEAPFPPRRMKPLRDQAREGRANPKGIAYLYLATHRDTACAEVRPWLGAYISLAQFELVRNLRLVNCTEDSKRKHFIDGTPPSYWDTAVWCDIDTAFSRPVSPTDDDAEYVPTQVIAEFFKIHGFDGVLYRSSLGQGHNVVLFDLDAAVLVNCALYQLKSMSFEFAQQSNPYFTQKISLVVERGKSESCGECP